MCIITCIGGGGGGTRGASGHTRPTLNESCPPILCQGCQTRGACSSFRERVLLQPLLPSLSGAPVHRDNPRGFWRTRTQWTPSLRQGMRTSPGPRRGPWTCGRTFANSLVNATSHAIRRLIRFGSGVQLSAAGQTLISLSTRHTLATVKLPPRLVSGGWRCSD